MKKLIGVLLLTLGTGVTLYGQTSSLSGDKNYVVTYSPRVGFTTPSQLSNRPANEVNQTVQYFDGLGRPMQTVQTFASPTNKDIVQPVEYDSYGREAKKYLPYAEGSSYGAYKSNAITSQNAFYNSGSTYGVITIPSAGGITPSFAETKFELSPLNRVIEQGAPGDAWQLSNGHTVKMEYGSNASSEVYLWTISTGGGASCTNSFYGANQLYKTVSKDENWTSGKAGTIEEFKDKEGKVVLKRIWESETVSLSTYYVYDDFGNLKYVIPPAVSATSFTEGSTDDPFNQFIYAYHYDHRNRVEKKKLPGKGWEELMYNTLDQVVLSRDAIQQSQNKWLYTKYDAFGRVISTGVFTTTDIRSTLQTQIDAAPKWEIRSSGSEYPGTAFPTTGITPLTVNYYDSAIPGASSLPAQVTVTNRLKDLLTGSKVYTVDGSASYLTANYYNEEGRLIESVSQNHKSGIDRIVNTYNNITGELMSSHRTHNILGSGNTTVATGYTYDHVGRKKQTTQSINGATPIVLSELSYSETGQLKDKALHNGIQSTGYTYNERGWLRTQNSGKFNLDLRYNTPDTGTPQYNGNIAQQFYSGDHSGSKSIYYGYDKLNRLENAVSTAGTLNESLSYDKMGNIQSLTRGGQSYSTLSYTYHNSGQSNQLASVSGTGFATRNYLYDANGNATSDGKTKTIEYNLLNLPSAIKQSGTTIASYNYTASGVKLSNTGSDGIWDYINGIIYKNSQIEFIQTEEGKAVRSGSAYNYVYNLKDHLGNVRVSIDQYNSQARVVQEDEYYSFGLQKALYNFSNNNRYLYNGKEKQVDLEDQYDYGARFYDPVIARWTTIDPLAEKMRRWSPYNYCFNNPMRFIDPDGMKPGDLFKTVDRAARDFGKTFNDNSIREGQEYGSTIYVVNKNGKTYYTYTNPNKGGNDAVTCSTAPDGTKPVADIHSHGKYEKGYDNNHFSPTDKNDNDKTGLTGYLTSPDGALQKYDPKTGKTSVLSTDLSSDPNDPDRKNTISPTEKPLTLKPLSEIKIPENIAKQDNTRVAPVIKRKEDEQND
ncbi:DUF6443 domain-containing protein [Paradesertivirga mongoliensis]|uniref:DUF6443 domain-containing protein n=1 Tax=Paradesertivirga mongoliensis TaxID=2100740 RepID=A0ABW4ZK28_9SPHI|nr:DUF6443 domain-containing protein [Pedobacter mongoliensis]